MNIYISYFNNIRNMNKYLIPVSTAKWDPKWFHKEDGLSFIDKNGVINGLRCNKLVFRWEDWVALCAKDIECRKECHLYYEVMLSESWCPFMQYYYAQLQHTNYYALIDWFRMLCAKAQELWYEEADKFDIVLLVHEKPDRKCAERPVLVKWFKDHGIEVKEWQKES